MPVAVVILLLDLTLVVHAAKTGRLCPWAYIILAIPGFGAIAYIVMEVVPDWMRTIEAQKIRILLSRTLNRHKQFRALNEQLNQADTIANRLALANECLSIARYDEAREHFDAILRRPLGDEPAFMLGRAKAEFGQNQFECAIATLDDLRARWPEFQSAEAHMIYARALEGAGRTDDALVEYEALTEYCPGAEARVRLGMLLTASGRRAEARTLFASVLERIGRMPKYVRKVEAEWIALAEKGLKI